jgi:tyrosyl-tRNA synthetase
VHGEHECARAIEVSEALFGRGALGAIDPDRLLVALDGVPTIRVGATGAPASYARLLVESGLAASASEARRLVAGGGVAANDARIADADAVPGPDAFLDGRILLLRKGKRGRALVLREG